jgi:CHAT domain-containing protein
VTSTADSASVREEGSSFELRTRATGLSPLALTGLALAGANLGRDRSGSVPGIVTAEEIFSLDLSHCDLVVLSACSTSLGVCRAGQGYGSLRSALQGAGAGAVLTSLWPVRDATTRKLMIEFYRRFWGQGLPVHRALWEAKMTIRDSAEAGFADWAGWVLTGG